ncbi:TnpV protein [Hominenteromicrobium sp.]|uniref:TnpV protein n=1 Tax=Hominenteromicrobium sp. TaxID=3073581 RepID=UPI003A8C9090
MEQSLFEQMGGKYERQGDYLLPCLTLPAEEEQPVGIWGQRHGRFLKEHHRIMYYSLLTDGKLNSYLADVDRQAEEMLSRLVTQMAEQEGITETLKAQDQMAWVRQMNNIRSRATEIVYHDLIFA